MRGLQNEQGFTDGCGGVKEYVAVGEDKGPTAT